MHTVVEGYPEKLNSVLGPHGQAPRVHVDEHVVEGLRVALDANAHFARPFRSRLRRTHLLEQLGEHRALRGEDVAMAVHRARARSLCQQAAHTQHQVWTASRRQGRTCRPSMTVASEKASPSCRVRSKLDWNESARNSAPAPAISVTISVSIRSSEQIDPSLARTPQGSTRAAKPACGRGQHERGCPRTALVFVHA